MTANQSSPLILRDPTPADENQTIQADAELAVDGFNFSLRYPEHSWTDYLVKVSRDREGRDLPPGRVSATMLFAFVGRDLVGRVHIRHALTPELLAVGGHIGYGVRPAHRGNGYATAMLTHGLDVLRERGLARALVTCDEVNRASQRTIERCAGVLENTVETGDGIPKRRYWIDLAPRA